MKKEIIHPIDIHNYLLRRAILEFSILRVYKTLHVQKLRVGLVITWP